MTRIPGYRGGRPRADFPTPGKRRRGSAWSIYWSAGGVSYAVSAGRAPEEEAEARRLETALALRTDDWPAWARGAPAVQRYRSLRRRAQGDLVSLYERSLRAEVSAGWADAQVRMLRELERVSGRPASAVTPAEADAFLSHVRETPGPFLKRRGPRTIATRNHVRKACRRFYRWAVRTGRLQADPFAETRPLRESRETEIVHLTRAERDLVVTASDGMADGVAVRLALYAGLRRGEIARARWADVDVERRKLIVPRSKTRRSRTVDLAGPLATYLAGRRDGPGRIVPWPAAAGRWEYASERCIARLSARVPSVPAERIGWNAFRHTFASLLVQAGVSVYKVSRWIGNGIEVCTRHYAAMRPDLDADIDRLA